MHVTIKYPVFRVSIGKYRLAKCVCFDRSPYFFYRLFVFPMRYVEYVSYVARSLLARFCDRERRWGLQVL
jgi:hypothetical protein